TIAFTSTRVWAPRRAAVAADTTRLVLFPLEGRTSSHVSWRDDDLMNQALSRWRGLRVVDQFQVADGVRRTGPNLTPEDAESLARSLGAGRYIRGKLTEHGSQWRAYVVLYDVGASRPLYSAADQIPTDLAAASAAYSRLADSLLLRGASVDSSPSNQVGSRSLPELQAFVLAQLAMDEWILEAADLRFAA